MPIKRHAVADTDIEYFGIVLPKNSDWTPVLTEFFEHDGGYLNSVRYKEILSKHLGHKILSLIKTLNTKS